jgi:hypothetical protein
MNKKTNFFIVIFLNIFTFFIVILFLYYFYLDKIIYFFFSNEIDEINQIEELNKSLKRKIQLISSALEEKTIDGFRINYKYVLGFGLVCVTVAFGWWFFGMAAAAPSPFAGKSSEELLDYLIPDVHYITQFNIHKKTSLLTPKLPKYNWETDPRPDMFPIGFVRPPNPWFLPKLEGLNPLIG